MHKQKQAREQSQYDIIILGAGIVGLVAANLCAQNQMTVALVDPKLPASNWDASQFDLRCSAIAKNSQQVLQSLQVWEDLCRQRVSPYYSMEVWDALSTGVIRFDAAEMQEPDLGHIIENSLLIKVLWERLQASEYVDQFIPGKPLGFTREDKQVILTLDGGTSLRAKLLIGADGAKSWLRYAAGIKLKERDYQQNAIVATVTTEFSHQATARQSFKKDEILAFLPLKGALEGSDFNSIDPNISSIVWSLPKERSDALMSLDAEEFAKELAYAFDYRLGKVLSVSSRAVFPLVMQEAVNYIEDRIALIGDAAHVIHPLAGQGVNLGIADAEKLAAVLLHGKQNAYDIGSRLFLRTYERERKAQNIVMSRGMDFFKKIFSIENSALQALRGLGINAVNASSFVKKRLMYQAMGL